MYTDSSVGIPERAIVGVGGSHARKRAKIDKLKRAKGCTIPIPADTTLLPKGQCHATAAASMPRAPRPSHIDNAEAESRDLSFLFVLPDSSSLWSAVAAIIGQDLPHRQTQARD